MTLNKLYNNQQQAFKAIDNGTFNYSEENKRLSFIKDNLHNIESINGMKVKDVNLISNNLEWNNNLYCRPIIYLDIDFK